METKRGRRRQRAVMATDSEWQAVRQRAETAGMDVSRFPAPAPTKPVFRLLLHRLTAFCCRVVAAYRWDYSISIRNPSSYSLINFGISPSEELVRKS